MVTMVDGREDGTSEEWAETVRLLVSRYRDQQREELATPESPSQTSKSSLERWIIIQCPKFHSRPTHLRNVFSLSLFLLGVSRQVFQWQIAEIAWRHRERLQGAITLTNIRRERRAHLVPGGCGTSFNPGNVEANRSHFYATERVIIRTLSYNFAINFGFLGESAVTVGSK